jgi:hypothetical protein
MTRTLIAVAIAASLAGASRVSAHHSYAAYDTTRLVEIEGTIEEFQYLSPHSLLRVRDRDGRLYVFEWLAINAMKRWSIEADTLKKGEHVIVGGNPRRDFDESGIVNCKSVRRPADDWKWPNR